MPVAFPLAIGVLPPERVFVFLREVTLIVIQTVTCSTVDTHLGRKRENGLGGKMDFLTVK